MPGDVIADDELRTLLSSTTRIAVLGASARPTRASYRVADYLARHGYAILPVNPRHAGERLHGHRTVASLSELEAPVDMVDVFRRSEEVPRHVDEILAMRPLPRVVWLQLGIRNDAAAAALRGHGIVVVQDRCTKVEHERLLADRTAGAEA